MGKKREDDDDDDDFNQYLPSRIPLKKTYRIWPVVLTLESSPYRRKDPSR